MRLAITIMFAAMLAGQCQGQGLCDPQPGDANMDGQVDGMDYLIWAGNYGIETLGGPGDGDFNEDGAVDQGDYTLWATVVEYGPVYCVDPIEFIPHDPLPGTTPEPGTAGLLLAGLTLWILGWRRRLGLRPEPELRLP